MNNCMTCIDDTNRFLQEIGGDLSNAYVSYKLDGVRTLAKVYRSGEVNYFSRSGKVFDNFSKFSESLRILAAPFLIHQEVVVFDGEVTSKLGQFKNVMQQLRRHKDVDPSAFVYNIFDIIDPEDELWERYERLCWLFDKYEPLEDVVLLEHLTVWNNVQELMQLALEKGYEGLVLKDKHSKYEFRRSPAWYKVKESKTLDLPVVDYVEGTGKYEGMLGALKCVYHGKTVKVGTGFTDEERKEFWKNPPRLIEVGYQQESSKGSLRHPRFLRVREDKAEHD